MTFWFQYRSDQTRIELGCQDFVLVSLPTMPVGIRDCLGASISIYEKVDACTCSWCETVPEIVNLPGSLARMNQCLVVGSVLHSIVVCIPQKSFRAKAVVYTPQLSEEQTPQLNIGSFLLMNLAGSCQQPMKSELL
ncbi:hypothetical protein PHYBLDRAFT_170678 [Phycomyces blakesleeanus NRRL 1555(-)]|uniref:Uncharacterized protein n=1 Tax=Phycomyces blakesleeanus (strain ATCC 8743b / DSM 1359 / FGSC 10004 / NBRC 33097 / NRRL 1555) TaxID=763407 RepID=A0A167LXR3_PHYB8|nr:hypothetical protein PHYBLDRAFT_170678 [Phycomyces blakesleeanus NRRL 1555(-)]OAD71308.1 hypothetical protein PHYBLDRAFT_170678 [Phycomyces blakesleeanus NRRL 1555(-)]|eukprot:XP_018289348.1 hypothetical protein PHYBLDRAFT_170678 [Phycomyces blakesleeanus NRRL 1555(-)]